MDDRLHLAEELMYAFAARTGIIRRNDSSKTRYLWTDAYAVCNFLSIYLRTGDEKWLEWARSLVELVHRFLGRHRDDDVRSGWISGLCEDEAREHPTRGGLRIGKKLKERGPHEPYDDRLEWERDGQYFHYLTKWMHALNRVSFTTGDAQYNAWAMELAETACGAFIYQTPAGEPRMFWKMSIDLSRPLVSSMGQLDPLDGFVAVSRLVSTAKDFDQRPTPRMEIYRSTLRRMCGEGTWLTADELGIGGMLTEAAQIAHLISSGDLEDEQLLVEILAGIHNSCQYYLEHNGLNRPAAARLAFRELGLSSGSHAVEPLRQSIVAHEAHLVNKASLLALVTSLTRFEPVGHAIELFWSDPANQRAATWTSHLDINSVMLATSLATDAFFSNRFSVETTSDAFNIRG